MNLILFIHQDASEKGNVLKAVIEQHFDRVKLTTLQTFNAFKARLQKGPGLTEKEIFIVLVDTRSRLTELTSLIDLLDGKRIILILPDESKDTLSRASQFFPRFFTPISKTYHDLCDVLNKMINQKQIKPNEYI